MILLPFNAHSNVINQHCRAPHVLGRALIVLLLIIYGNVHVMYNLAHQLLLAPVLFCALTFASLISALVKAWVLCTLTIEAYYLKWIN